MKLRCFLRTALPMQPALCIPLVLKLCAALGTSALAGCSAGGYHGPLDAMADDLAALRDLGIGCVGLACGADGGGDMAWGRPACTPQPGLGACYSFDETGGQVLDGSGNHNDGTLEGSGWARVGSVPNHWR